MKCPVCGEQLRPGKKDPNYLLCYTCKKKYKAPQKNSLKEKDTSTSTGKKMGKKEAADSSKPKKRNNNTNDTKKVSVEDEDFSGQKYSNIPPKKVRDKREEEMRKAYDELLAVGDGKKKKKKAKKEEEQYKRSRRYEEEYEDDYDVDDYDYEDEDDVSKAPIIILGIAIVIVAGLIAYMLLK